MILIGGPSGSGKTTVAKSLQKQGYRIIPVYTTRPRRTTVSDDFSVSIEPEKFKEAVNQGRFLTHITVHTLFGPWSYGMRLRDFSVPYENIVAMVVYDYIADFNRLIRLSTQNDRLFIVYLDVDEYTILRNASKGKRGEGDIDNQVRLHRDREKDKRLKDTADLIIDNHGFHLSVDEVTSTIIREYNAFKCRKEATYYETNARYKL